MPMKKDPFDALRGNEMLKRFFRGEIEKGTLAHAYILEGGEGSGRHTLALAVAAALAEGVPEGEKIARGLSPDVLVYRPAADKKQFSVEIVRKMREDVYILPNELPFKCCLIEKCEMMTVQAQNAALKILEEPPANTYFFLLCENAASLLPTVRSRAPALRMQRFTAEEMDELLCAIPEAAGKKKANEPFFFSCIQNSGGSFGKALRLLREDDASSGRETVLKLFDIWKDRAAFLLFTAELSKKRPEFDEFLLQLREALRDLLLYKTGGEKKDFLFFLSNIEAAQAGAGLAKEQLLKAEACVEELQGASARNANLQNMRLTLYSRLTNAFSS